MINVITELYKYVILTLMIVYTFHSFYMVWSQDEEEKKELLESLELYYRVFFLGEEVPEEALMEEDGEKPNGK